MPYSTSQSLKDQYDIALQAQQKADMDTFLHEVRNEQIRLEVLNKPDAVIMCTEIEGQPARVKPWPQLLKGLLKGPLNQV